MSGLIASSEVTAVIGGGATGLSVARFLARENKRFMIFDTRQTPPNLQALREEFPEVPLQLGPLSADTLAGVSRIVLSPGLSAREPAIREARERGVEVIGDIQLFNEYRQAPMVAISGSNGKSTVTTLVGEMFRAAGQTVAVGGNLGTPALDLLGAPEKPQCYVLELSSFQLETTAGLNAEVAVLLNLSADHMDRYESMQDYHAAKQRIFQGARKVVVNREDALTQPLLSTGVDLCSFGLDRPDLKQFGLREEDGRSWLCLGLDKLIAADELKMVGRHNLANALAALAIAWQAGLPFEPVLQVLREFPGLAHRCEWLGSKSGVDFINDSKGTNTGATLAALRGLSRLPSRLVLIAGGEGKGADFSELAPALRDEARAVVTIGADGEHIAAVARQAGVVTEAAADLREATRRAFALAESGDAVLLSPACASFDMFSDYVDRGEQFATAVQEVLA